MFKALGKLILYDIRKILISYKINYQNVVLNQLTCYNFNMKNNRPYSGDINDLIEEREELNKGGEGSGKVGHKTPYKVNPTIAATGQAVKEKMVDDAKKRKNLDTNNQLGKLMIQTNEYIAKFKQKHPEGMNSVEMKTWFEGGGLTPTQVTYAMSQIIPSKMSKSEELEKGGPGSGIKGHQTSNSNLSEQNWTSKYSPGEGANVHEHPKLGRVIGTDAFIPDGEGIVYLGSYSSTEEAKKALKDQYAKNSVNKSQIEPKLIYKAEKPYSEDINDLIEKGGVGSGIKGHIGSPCTSSYNPKPNVSVGDKMTHKIGTTGKSVDGEVLSINDDGSVSFSYKHPQYGNTRLRVTQDSLSMKKK